MENEWSWTNYSHVSPFRIFWRSPDTDSGLAIGPLGRAGAKPVDVLRLTLTFAGHQPVGTGFSQGKPNLKDEVDLSRQLVGFFEQFLSVFSELKGKDFYVTGESYAGEHDSADRGPRTR